MFGNVLFLRIWPGRDFFKKVAHVNSESFALIFIWGLIVPGPFCDQKPIFNFSSISCIFETFNFSME